MDLTNASNQPLAFAASARSIHGHTSVTSFQDPDVADIHDGVHPARSTPGSSLAAALRRGLSGHKSPTATAVVPMGRTVDSTSTSRTGSLTTSTFPRVASTLSIDDQRVVKYGLSLPLVLFLSVAICVTYTKAYLSGNGVHWIPRDLTGDAEWASYTRTHLTQDPLLMLDEVLSPSTVGVDTSISVRFLEKYGTAKEADVHSTAAILNRTWLDPGFIMGNGFSIAGQMAGSFEAYGVWPCSVAITKHPIVATVCPDPTTDWFAIQIYNNLVATTSEKASAILSLSYAPMSLMSARIWPAMKPSLVAGGAVVKGYKEGAYTERTHFLLSLEQGRLALAKVSPCNRATQSNALECDLLENDDVYVRNGASRDFEPLHKLDKIGVYGPAYALGNYVAADKTFVQLPARTVMMTDTGYSASVRTATTFPFRLTVVNGKLTCEYSISQVAAYTEAVGTSFAAGAIQMMVVCLIVLNAVAHLHTSHAVVNREGHIFGFASFITTGIIARRLGTYKLVAAQLCIYHALNVRTYFAAVYYSTQSTMDTLAFASEGVLLTVVFTMLLDQVVFFERYSSVRETLTVLGSCGVYLLHLFLMSTYFISREQVQVTEIKACAYANTCYVIEGLLYYYLGVAVCLLVPVGIVNGPIHRWIISTRSSYPTDGVHHDKLTSFERYCVGMDARVEFGSFDRASTVGTPISIVHAVGFTYVGPYLVRVKDYYMVVVSRWCPEFLIKSCGLTIALFRVKEGKVIAGRHMLLGAAYKLFRQPHREPDYQPIQ